MGPAKPERDRTPARVLGVAGLAGLMIVLVVSIALIAGGGEDDADEVAAQPTATATATATPTTTPTPKPTPPPLSATERAERDAAIAIVESRGFTAERPGKDWDPEADLQVLIGTSTDQNQLAFFFVNGDYLGNDSTESSGKIRVKASDGLQVTLNYGKYERGDELHEPTGKPIPIDFRYDGSSVEPVQTLPLINERSQPLP